MLSNHINPATSSGLSPGDKTQTTDSYRASTGRTSPAKIAPSQNIRENDNFFRYHCSPEWHLIQLTSTPFAGLVYNFVFRISKGSGLFHGSAEGVARYFGVSRWTIQRAMQALVDLGFPVRVAQEAYTPSVYHVIGHKEWAAKHPGCCAEKETLPWSDETGDPLGVRLWSLSGGKVKYQSYQVKALRKTGLTDDQIAKAFEAFVTAEQARREEGGWHGRWGAVQPRFLRWITGRLPSDELERLGLQPFRTPSEPAEAACSSCQKPVAV